MQELKDFVAWLEEMFPEVYVDFREEKETRVKMADSSYAAHLVVRGVVREFFEKTVTLPPGVTAVFVGDDRVEFNHELISKASARISDSTRVLLSPDVPFSALVTDTNWCHGLTYYFRRDYEGNG